MRKHYIKENGKFVVTSFDGTYYGHDGFCNVLTKNGTERVPIDKQNRIIINGKKYTEKHWKH